MYLLYCVLILPWWSLKSPFNTCHNSCSFSVRVSIHCGPSSPNQLFNAAFFSVSFISLYFVKNKMFLASILHCSISVYLSCCPVECWLCQACSCCSVLLSLCCDYQAKYCFCSPAYFCSLILFAKVAAFTVSMADWVKACVIISAQIILSELMWSISWYLFDCNYTHMHYAQIYTHYDWLFMHLILLAIILLL